METICECINGDAASVGDSTTFGRVRCREKDGSIVMWKGKPVLLSGPATEIIDCPMRLILVQCGYSENWNLKA